MPDITMSEKPLSDRERALIEALKSARACLQSFSGKYYMATILAEIDAALPTTQEDGEP